MSRVDRAYIRRHEMVTRARGRADSHMCECGYPAQEWATIHSKDGLVPEDYIAMCCSCHQIYDDHWNAETRQKVSGSLVDYWSSPDGLARREEMKGHNRAAGKRTPEQIENIKRGAAEGRRKAAERRLAAREVGG